MKRFLFAALVAIAIGMPFASSAQAVDPTFVVNAQRDRVTVNHLDLTTTTETTLIAAGGAGVSRDLTFLMVGNESATEVLVLIRDATAGAVIFEFALPGGESIVMPFFVPMPQTAANNNWTAEIDAAVTEVHFIAMTIDIP